MRTSPVPPNTRMTYDELVGLYEGPNRLNLQRRIALARGDRGRVTIWVCPITGANMELFEESAGNFFVTGRRGRDESPSEEWEAFLSLK